MVCLFELIYSFSRKSRIGESLLRLLYGCDIPWNAKIVKDVQFAHRALGVVIHKDEIINEGCFIYHNVTSA